MKVWLHTSRVLTVAVPALPVVLVVRHQGVCLTSMFDFHVEDMMWHGRCDDQPEGGSQNCPPIMLLTDDKLYDGACCHCRPSINTAAGCRMPRGGTAAAACPTEYLTPCL
jgi:hypothetical protein